MLRAAVMGAIALLAIAGLAAPAGHPGARRPRVLVLMTVAPQLAVDVGFALSVSATAALVRHRAGLVATAGRRVAGRSRWPTRSRVAVAAQLVTAPLIAGISGSVSLVAVAANLVVAPVIPPITVLGTAAAALCACAGRRAAQLLIRFTGPELWWLLRVARWAAGVPGATVPVPAGVAGCAASSASAALQRYLAVAVAVASRQHCVAAAGLPGRVGDRGHCRCGRDTIVG